MTLNIFEHFTEKELALLKARADRAAARAKEPEQTELVTVLFVRIGTQNWREIGDKSLKRGRIESRQ